MAKLERKKFKVFGENAPLDEIGQFGSAKATTKKNTKDIEEIQELDAWSDGWGGAVISNKNYPPMEEMTGAMNVMSYQTAYTLQEGIPEWNKDTTYYKGSIVKNLEGEDVKLYQSISNDNLNKPLSNTDNWSEISFGGSGLEVCDIGMALYVDETKGLRRYLNGQIVDINANTQAFLNRLKEITTLYPSLLCTEEEWQTAKTMSAFGQVGKFVFNYSGDEIVSVRIPAIVNVQGLFDLQNLGMTVGAGLPNITGSIGAFAGDNVGYFRQYNTSGAFSGTGSRRQCGSTTGAENRDARAVMTFDASRSNQIYGNSDTVQQEAIQYPYFIQIATGSETEANIVNTLENVNGFTLLESKYSDKPLYNESWLLSNGQWNAKAVYPTAYEGLQVEYNTEIEAGTTVTLPSGVSYTKRGLSVKLSTETYTDYEFVLNTTDETFRLPLKTKQKFYDDVAPVVGNGMAIGLTNGIKNVSMGTVNNVWQFTTNVSNYGKQLPQDTISNADISGVLGVTTNPTKSGIETHLTETTLYLYFYVGDIDQNHGIVNMGRIGEVKADRSELDGMWVFLSKSLFNNITMTSNQVKDVDISSILPNDGNLYELIITADYSIPAGAGNQGALSVCSDVWANTIAGWFGRSVNTASGIIGATAGQSTMLVGASRILHFRQNAKNDITAVFARIIACRKVR